MGVLQRNDWYLIGVGLVLSVIVAALGQFGIATLQHELIINDLTAIPIVLGVVFIWLARDQWGGNVARYLELIGTGLVLHLILWIPHVRWHLMSEESTAAAMWLGLDLSFWYVFFHALSLLAFTLITYGFYLFWREGTA